ncbi:HGGxSTG domain-containing protein [Zhongshania sp.]|uniref:HGGxSTG domain-containing protein n=1 Tax=Zhongshania sp. TaxID=1971902 RepID=UPI0039C74441
MPAIRLRWGRQFTGISVCDNGRCKFYGGPSTGPRTAEGKARPAANGFKRT